MAVAGIPLLKRVIDSAQSLSFVDEIVVATTHLPADIPIKSFCDDLNLKCIQGDVVDVLNRYAEASSGLSENDVVIRWTADNPFVNSSVFKKALSVFNNESADYLHIHNLSHIVPEIIKVGILRDMNKRAVSSFDREHVTPWIRKNRKYYSVVELPSDYEGLRPELDKYFTIDTLDQLKLIETMISDCEIGSRDIDFDVIYSYLDKSENHVSVKENVVLKARLEGTLIGDRYPAYIIAEIGQNHNGDINIAKKLIDMSVRCGANAVKFQKRHIPSDLTKEAYDKPYLGPNSFGSTYGEHREFLELSEEEHLELKEYANASGITYFITPTDVESVEMAERVGVPFYKVASRDLTNIPLLDYVAATRKPVIVSTGMATEDDIKDALKVMEDRPESIMIMQCTSQYPAELENVNLNAMATMRERFNKIIGYSDHTAGIIASVTAAIMGAALIENHVTLSRAMKGTDQAGSLEERGLKKMIDYIRQSEKAKGDSEKIIDSSVEPAKIKLARSLTSSCLIKKDTVLDEKMITLKSPGNGIIWRDRNIVIGKKAIKDIEPDMTLRLDYFSE